MASSSEERSAIVFFDLETTIPSRPDEVYTILEFGAILVCPRNLVELENSSYSTLIKPADVSCISDAAVRKGITPEALSDAPTFREVAYKIFDLLHGRVWAGHNIVDFDWVRIQEAFEEIDRRAPEPKRTIDTLTFLREKFGWRAENMKMASLANYFELGEQTHRSLDDVRMNLEVLKNCAAVLFLESSLPDIFITGNWLSPDEVSIPSIRAAYFPFYRGERIQLLHRNVFLQLYCSDLRVHFGPNSKFRDQAGRPRLNIVVDIPSRLRKVLDKCNYVSHKLTMDSGSNSEWRPLVKMMNGSSCPTIQLNIPIVENGDNDIYETEIYDEASGNVFNRFDLGELKSLFLRGTLVEAYFSLDVYDYLDNAGIRLVAKKLIINFR